MPPYAMPTDLPAWGYRRPNAFESNQYLQSGREGRLESPSNLAGLRGWDKQQTQPSAAFQAMAQAGYSPQFVAAFPAAGRAVNGGSAPSFASNAGAYPRTMRTPAMMGPVANTQEDPNAYFNLRATAANRLAAMQRSSDLPGTRRMGSSLPRDIGDQADFLSKVLGGGDVRFGTTGGASNLPFSMFNSRTVRAGGNYAVNPMLPTMGVPQAAASMGPMGTTADERAANVAAWGEGRSPGTHGSVLQSINGGDRVIGFAKPANGKGPGWSYMDPSQSAGVYNQMAASRPGLNLKPLSINADGSVIDAAGNKMDAMGISNMVLNARMASRQSKTQQMRGNEQFRRAFRAAQRGDMSKLGAMAANGKLGNLIGGAQQPAENPMHQQVFDMAAGLANSADVPPHIRMAMAGELMGAMLDPAGAGKIPGMLGRWGVAARGDEKKNALKSKTAVPTLDEVNQLRTQFSDPKEFLNFAAASGWNNEKTNKALVMAFGPDTGLSAENRSGGFVTKSQIDPATGRSTDVARFGDPFGLIPQAVNTIGGWFGGFGPRQPGVPQQPVPPQSRPSEALNRWGQR